MRDGRGTGPLFASFCPKGHVGVVSFCFGFSFAPLVVDTAVGVVVDVSVSVSADASVSKYVWVQGCTCREVEVCGRGQASTTSQDCGAGFDVRPDERRVVVVEASEADEANEEVEWRIARCGGR